MYGDSYNVNSDNESDNRYIRSDIRNKQNRFYENLCAKESEKVIKKTY